MVKIIKLSAIILLFFISSISFAQQKDPMQDLSTRVQILEKQKEELNDYLKLSLQAEVNEIRNSLKENYLQLIKIGVPFSLAGLITIILLYIRIKRKVEHLAELKAVEKFENLFNEEKQRLIDLVQEEIKRYQLKRSKSILVITHPDSKEVFIRKFFREMEIPDVKFAKIKESEKPIKITEDLLLFNDEDGKFEEQFILELIAKSPKKVMCFYFGPKKITRKEDINRISFANVRVQLYGNLLNALRYQELLT